MAGRLDALYRHPVKGFTPERLDSATLTAGAHFPCDRLYAVENGPSGFDPDAPGHMSKWKFTVLAHMPQLARARSRYDEASGVFTVEAEGQVRLNADLGDEAGREALAAWLAGFLDDEAKKPLKVLGAPPHRFMDHPQGHVSLVNLESVRDLARRTGRAIDPLRFRANLYVEGWPAWSEMQAVGGVAKVGAARLEIERPIMRCMATHVDPATGERDIDLVGALHENYGHTFCGVYLKVVRGGLVTQGDKATAP